MRRRFVVSFVVGVVGTSLLTTNFVATTEVAADGTVGVQGTDTSLPLTDSAVTLAGRGRFADLEVTVNQTESLTNQALSLTWTGADPTQEGASGRFGNNFLQIFQCWGDDDGTNPDNPGPPPTQCQQGAVGGSYQFSDSSYPGRYSIGRIIYQNLWDNFDPDAGTYDTGSGFVWLPFKAVDGTTIPIQEDPTWRPFKTGSYWMNPYYNQITTNEIAAAATRPDGTGAELFQVNTGLEASGLGCGQKVQPLPDGTTKVPKCWLVVVPRGMGSDENANTSYGGADADVNGVVTSPLMPGVWENRIAFPLEFNPLDSPCKLGQNERRLSGTELAFPAIASWQPQLCTTGSQVPYSFAPVGDAQARQQLTGLSGAPGMVVVQRPQNPEFVDAANPVVYSPLTVSGITIGFNIDRILAPNPDPAEAQFAAIRVADIYLTPRLVAKLLTQSYRAAVTMYELPTYSWVPGNPLDLTKDPDFLQFNPEFVNLTVFDTRAFSGLSVPAGTSDAAQTVWEWIFADPEAKAWLDGEDDPWGMSVNPVYSTNASVNPNGTAFNDPTPTSFPKSDPYCYQAPAVGTGEGITPPALCSTDWNPYQRNFAVTAQVGRSANDGAKVIQNPFPISTVDTWSKAAPQSLGRHTMLVLTDTPNAALFGLQTASLSRAGDNGANRVFVEPNSVGLAAGLAAMRPASVSTVLEPTPSVTAAGAYPLTTVAYAMTKPLALDSTARTQYAAFLQFATTTGQTPGLDFGQLPRGYLPLPQSLQQQAASSIDSILHLEAPPTTTTTTVPTTTVPATVPTVATTPKPRTSGGVPAAQPSATPEVSETSAPISVVVVVELPESTSPPTASSTTVAASVTPSTADGKSRLVVPFAGGLTVLSAVGALEITKRPRRRLPKRGAP
ncbi:MAG: hypothetical protein K8R99_02045 [Actinomycetia bacterium]|nr:hypothetical protein [Actinomycetes bacterium]